MTFLFIVQFAKIKTGAHSRYVKLMNQTAQRGKRVVCYCPDQINFCLDKRVIRIPYSINGAQSVAINLGKLVFTNRYRIKSILNDDRTTIITFGETTVISAIILKIFLNITWSLGIRSDAVTRARVNNLSKVRILLIKTLIWLGTMFSDQIIFQTKTQAEQLRARKFLWNTNIQYLNNGIDNLHRQKSRKIETIKNVLFIGNGSEVKGSLVLLEAIFQLPKQLRLQLQFHLVNPDQRTKENLKRQNETSFENLENIRIYEYKNDLSDLYHNSDLLIVPSLEDQFPNIIFEGIIEGLCVIGSSTGGIIEMLPLSNRFQSNDPIELSEKIISLTDRKTLNQCIALANQHIRRFDFDWSGEYLALVSKIEV